MAIELKRSKYRLLGLIGQGQFGRVYCAVHRRTGKPVALKDLDQQRFPTHKFLRELRFLLSLQHRNIVNCQALEHTRTGRYLVLDYCEGGTLRGLMENANCLDVAQSLRLIKDILAGLAHAHSRGIIHCDIKPENILLTLTAQGWIARISDFGIARLSQELTGESGNTGSPAYMAPERFYGQHSPSSDLYAVGIMLFELLVGDRPFSGPPAELMSAHLNLPVKVPVAIPEPLQKVIITSLQKLPARRYHSATEMLQAFETAVESAEVQKWLATNPTCLCPDRSGPLPSLSTFVSIYREPLAQPLNALAVGRLSEDSTQIRFYKAAQTNFSWQHRDAENNWRPQPDSTEFYLLSEPIVALISRPQGCYLVGRKTLAILPPDAHQPIPLLTEAQDWVVAIEPQGRWLATATMASRSQTATVQIWQPCVQPDQALTLCLSKTVMTSHPVHAPKLLALDRRHLVLLSPTGPQFRETALQAFNRRGQFIGAWTLPVPMNQAMVSAQPYRLAALEGCETKSLLLVDLKPFRVLRVELEIQPVLLATTAWGYVLADANTQLVFLNQDGQQIGQIQPPLATIAPELNQPTAIVPCGSYGLLLATWNPDQSCGHLHTLDLRKLDLDLVF